MEEALGPMGQEGHPTVEDVPVVLVDPNPLWLHILHTSAYSLPLPSSHQGPRDEVDGHQGEDPSLGDPIPAAPLDPSLVGVHVVPKTQVVVAHAAPSLQEEGANHLDGPSLDEGSPNLEVVDPSLDEDLEGPWEDILVL